MVDPSRSRRHLRWSLRGRPRCPASTNCSVGQSLALSTNQSQIGSGMIVISGLDPIRIAEVKLAEIPLQVSLGHVMVNAVDAALEDREISLDGVGIDIPHNVFFGGVVDGAVAREVQPTPL